MPVNYQEIQGQIRHMGELEPQRVQRLKEMREQAAQLLETHNNNIDTLQDWVKEAIAANNNLRCAVPVEEALMSQFPPPLPPERVGDPCCRWLTDQPQPA